MPVITLIRDRSNPGNQAFTGIAGKRAYLYTEDGKLSFAFEMAPREGSFSGVADDWVTTERPQDTPLLQRKGRSLMTFKATTVLADKYDPMASMVSRIYDFHALAKSDQRVLFRYGLLETGVWRITEASYDVKQRHPVTSDPTNVEIAFTLTQAVGYGDTFQGPAMGMATQLNVSPIASGSRSHVLAAGETLFAVAQRYYGSGALWVQIYDANRGVLDLPYGFNPGTRLVIP